MNEQIYELIAACFAGELSYEQNKRLQEWLGKSEKNKQVFDELRDIWMYAETDCEIMENSKAVVLERVFKSVRRKRLWKPAAAIATFSAAVALGFAIASLTMTPEPQIESVSVLPEGEITLSTLPGQKAEATLPDGTKVWLNSGTTLTYPASYGITDRTATLIEGEIYLDVSKKDDMLFTLNTPHGLIKVHGTCFDARNYSEDPSMTVSLEQGSIEYLSGDETAKIPMVPGQRLFLDKDSGNMSFQKCDPDFESVWRFGEMRIEKESFLDVMADMEHWYGVEISVTGKTQKDTFYWMTIKTESLREMLSLLKKITPLSYEIDGKHVSIKLK